MATLIIPNTFVNGTAAIASEVNANFTEVKTFVEALAAGTNLDANAVTESKILDQNITYAKLSSSVTNIIAIGNDQSILSGQVFS
jgi:hypothetical protein